MRAASPVYKMASMARPHLHPLRTAARKIQQPHRSYYYFLAQQLLTSTKLCGINVIAYYSSKILVDADFSRTNSLIVSFGIGCTNFLFALPAIIMIDKFGRRPLLLATAPIMAGFLALTGAAFNLPLSSGLPTIISGLFLFVVAYSPGGGPVPFTYCAESWPLQVRSLGMGINTATTWLFNFLISFTFPLLVAHIGQQGTFYLYCGLNCMLEVLVWLLVPETRMLSLEELDVVFSVPTQQHISANWKALRNWRVPRRERKEKTYLEEDGVVVIPWPEKNVQRVLVEEVLSRSSDAEESSET